MAIVEKHCHICCQAESKGHWPKCPLDPENAPDPEEYVPHYGDNGTLMGTVTYWQRKDPRAPWNQKRAPADPKRDGGSK